MGGVGNVDSASAASRSDVSGGGIAQEVKDKAAELGMEPKDFLVMLRVAGGEDGYFGEVD